jgi:hypothetical protein
MGLRRKRVITQRQHLLNAGIIWTMVAAILIIRGAVWVSANVPMHHFIIIGTFLVMVFGVLKGRFIVSKMAVRMVNHIHNLDERSPFWKVYAVPTYLSIILMVGIGILCRLAGAHWHIFPIIGYIYAAIGIALLTGSTEFWREWHAFQSVAE